MLSFLFERNFHSPDAGLQVFEDKKHVYLVMELVTGGELFDKIVERVRGRVCCSVCFAC